MSAAVGKLGAILSGLLFNYLSAANHLGVANVLWIFFGCGILGAIMTFLFVPETKGVDADAIDYDEQMAKIGGGGYYTPGGDATRDYASNSGGKEDYASSSV